MLYHWAIPPQIEVNYEQWWQVVFPDAPLFSDRTRTVVHRSAYRTVNRHGHPDSPSGISLLSSSRAVATSSNNSNNHQHKSFALPWSLSGKESTCWCRRPGFHPWPGRIPQAAEQRSPRDTASEPTHLEPELCNKRSHHSKKPRARQLESSPTLPATRQKPRPLLWASLLWGCSTGENKQN